MSPSCFARSWWSSAFLIVAAIGLLLGVLALACAFVVMLRGDPVGGWTRPTTLVPLYLVGGGPALFLLLVWTQYLRRRDPPPPSGEERL